MHDSQYTAGWIDMRIHDFLASIEEPSSSMAYALVTCLDSCFDLPELLETSQHLEPLRGKCELIGQGILVTTRQLLAAERQRGIFFGFDEVWFFDHRSVQPKPENLVITGPSRITPELMPDLTKWMQSTGCSLALGDGTGMNFCARLRGIAKHLVEALAETGAEVTQDGQAST